MEVDRRLELQPKIFNLINSIWGPHQVDLFVSEEILLMDTRSGSRSYDANMIENEFMDQYSLVLIPRILAKIIRKRPRLQFSTVLEISSVVSFTSGSVNSSSDIIFVKGYSCKGSEHSRTALSQSRVEKQSFRSRYQDKGLHQKLSTCS